MKKYEEYTPSGVKWLGDLPSGWNCKKIGSLFSQRKTKVSDKDFAPLSVSKGGIVPQLDSAVKTDAGDNRKLVKSGDFVINSRSDRKGSCGVSQLDGSVSLINIVLEPRQSWNGRYVHYLMRSPIFSEEYYRYGRGIVSDLWTTRFSEMKNIMLPIPPQKEQDHIVSYLDWRVSKINKLIEVTKKKIKVLNEYRKAIVDESVLHGFGHTEKKESGIYWLGEIPQSWDTLPIKRICKVNASIAETAKHKSDDELVTFLPMENVTVNGEVDCSIKKPIGNVRSGYSSFAKGDVVVAKITPCFENGKGACLDCLDTEIGYGTTEFINLRPSERVLAQYLYLITMTQPFRKLGEEVMSGSAGQKRVPVEFIKNFTLGIPPVEEQKEIIKELDGKLHDIDNLIEKEKETITALHELKSRLISDVVTGQIDVRDVEVPEFEYIEEIEDSSEDGEETDDESMDEEV